MADCAIMRTRTRWLLLAAALPVAACGALAALVLQTAPRVPLRADVTPADVERALAYARQHDPRRLPPQRVQRAQVAERDADLLLHHAVQRWLGGQARLSLPPGGAELQASVPLAHTPLWLNLRAEWRPALPLPELVAVHVGRLPLPPRWAEALARRWAQARGLPAEALAVGDFVRHLGFAPGQVTVVYAYTDDARERVLGALLPGADRERVRAYAARLAAFGEAPAEDGSVSLATLLPPLFQLAAERSAAGGDAAAENRAALVALVLYTNRRMLDLVMPQAMDGLPARPLRVTLAGRDDFPRHWLISAAIATDSGTPLADAVGLWKELRDSRGGSGFSFNDLAADRAGTRLGELARRDPARVQQRLSGVLAEADFMPAVDDLPEFMTEAEFQARFGGVGGAAYRETMARIEQRIDALPVLR